jgi:hypothetical protein
VLDLSIYFLPPSPSQGWVSFFPAFRLPFFPFLVPHSAKISWVLTFSEFRCHLFFCFCFFGLGLCLVSRVSCLCFVFRVLVFVSGFQPFFFFLFPLVNVVNVINFTILSMLRTYIHTMDHCKPTLFSQLQLYSHSYRALYTFKDIPTYIHTFILIMS